MSLWAAGITAAVSVGTTMYAANQQKKNAAKAAGAQQGAAGGGFTPGKMPDFMPVDVNDVNRTAIQYDREGYARSDADFGRRHAGLLGAEKLFEGQVLRDQQGESELMPALQNEFFRSGLVNSLGSLGGGENVLAPGSAGEASLARNLGLSIMGFQDRNRQNRMQSLLTAESLFPRRKFGISGNDAAGLNVMNNAGQNNWNQAQFGLETQVQQGNYNNALASANIQAQAEAQQQAAKQQALLSAASLAGQLGSTAAGYYKGGGIDTRGAGVAGPNGSLYQGTYNGRPVYRPSLA